jgi:hypothetical protein
MPRALRLLREAGIAYPVACRPSAAPRWRVLRHDHVEVRDEAADTDPGYQTQHTELLGAAREPGSSMPSVITLGQSGLSGASGDRG